MSNTDQAEVERLLHAGLDPLFVKLQQFDSPSTRRLYHAMSKGLCLILATDRADALAELARSFEDSSGHNYTGQQVHQVINARIKNEKL